MVAGEFLEVTRDGETFALSLLVPIDRLSAWLDLDDSGGFWPLHERIRDEVMDTESRAFVQATEKVDAIAAVEVVRSWSLALRGRLGKALSLSPSGDSIEPLSPPTSGSDSE